MKAKIPERELWDERYRGGWLFGQEPNAYLQAQGYRLRPGMTALAVADGQGRNGVWLAQRGLAVTSIDISPLAMAHAKELAQQRAVEIQTVCADLTGWTAPEAAFDVIVEVYAHFPGAVRTAIHSNLTKALKPGGLFVFEGFHERQAGRASGGPKDPDMLYTPEKVARDLSALQILELLEGTVFLSEGIRHQGEAWIVRALARRPD
jgi:2-polyprenyl-3-methyl-5-hydroxy-6-metoxy-1,4-benzoquinol methylase